VSILDCVDENISEVESSDSDNEICGNQESGHKSGTSDSEQSDRQAAPAVSGWHDVHNKYNFNTSCMCTRAKNT
jgi:hypothetical protein